jgi:NAD(P)-dependent dehydrogenase (short-subunit alcohol dehydrogenase family)
MTSETSATPLAGLVAVVTGGCGHIGAALTQTMARQGARVVVADIDAERAGAHAAALASGGGDTLAVRVDIASDESVGAAFETVRAHFGGTDILVNNAAPSRVIAADAPALDIDLATWDTALAVMVRGALLCARHALPQMIARGGGSIVNIGSVHAHGGDLGMTAYPAAKAALGGLTKVLATQYGHLGVRCNTVTLGTIPYPFMSEQTRRGKVRHQLVKRDGLPADVASLVAFLVSPAASFLTGADYLADGGLLAHLPAYADAP